MPTVERLTDAPIIFPHMDSRMGDNIGTPSLIRVPDWVENRLGRYYLYFSHHKGRYIRMAHADRPTGPWVMHEPGVLDIADSLFPAEDPPEPPEHLRPAWAAKMKGGYLYAHIASPDVHVRQADRTIAMYFHGLLPNGDQSTRLAVSRDGLSFEVLPPCWGRHTSGSPRTEAGSTRPPGAAFCFARTIGRDRSRPDRALSISTRRRESARAIAMERRLSSAIRCTSSITAWGIAPNGSCTRPSS
jgi:hypothetical protein